MEFNVWKSKDYVQIFIVLYFIIKQNKSGED